MQLRTQRFSSQQGMPTRDPIGLPWKHANCRYFLGQREASARLCSGIPMLSHRGPIVLNLSSFVLLISCKISYISQCNRNPQTFLPSTQDCCLVPNSSFLLRGRLALSWELWQLPCCAEETAAESFGGARVLI